MTPYFRSYTSNKRLNGWFPFTGSVRNSNVPSRWPNRSDVTVTIARHLARYDEYKWPYLAKPFPVRSLKLGQLQAGTHTVTWDGFDEKGEPVVELQNVTPAELDRLKLTTATPEQLTQTLPVNLLPGGGGSG